MGVKTIEDYTFYDATSLTSITIPESVTSIGNSAFKFSTALTSITIPASVTSIGQYAFSEATSLKDVNVQGSAPSVGLGAFAPVAYEARVYVAADATGFGEDDYWNGLIVARLGTYTVTYNYNSATGDNSVASGSFTTFGAAITLPTPTRTGYTFGGWYSDAGLVFKIGESGASYSPTGAKLAKEIYARWTSNSTKAVAVKKPTIVGKAKVSKKLTAKKGTWIGNPTPVITYQWYACGKKISVAKSVVPKSCKMISRKTKSTLKLAKAQRGKFITVLVTGTSAATSATKWLAKSTTKVK